MGTLTLSGKVLSKKVETAEVEAKVEAIVEEISLANYGDFDFVWQGGTPIKRQFHL